MRKILKHKTAFLTKLAFAASYGNGIPIYVAILIEIISYSQILYIILTTSFSVSNEKNLLIFPEIRDFFSFLGLFEGSDTFETEISTELVWYAISIGLLAYTLFLSVLAILCRKEKNLKKGIVILCTVLTTVHSKLLFCPIYYFYINSILDHEKCTINNESLYMCGTVIKAFTLIFVMINAVLAILKEIICYQGYMNRNPFATKNNFHSLIQLTHKITILPIIVLTSDSLVPASVLNFFFTLPCLILLLLKLPHYNIKFLRTNVYLSTITATISFILVWKPLVTSRYRIFELLIILVVPVFIKVVHESLNAIFEKILSLRAITPEHVMHLYALTEQYIFHSGEVDMNRNSKYKTLFKYGVLKVTGLDVQAMENVSEVKNFKDEINLLILGQLLKSYKLNPRSRPLLIFIIQFYMQKIKNASQAVIFIEKMQNMALPIPIQSALVKIKDKLKSIMLIAYSQKDPSLEFINYFKYREISETLKANILSEVQMHIDFWQIISKNKVKASKIIKISEKINVLALKVQRMWEQHEKDFIKNFPVPIILYKVYLSLIRGVPHIAETYTDISIGQNDKVLKSMEKWFSQEKASIVGSIQKGTLGIVLDASHSVQNLFNIKKEDLIGRNVNILMPSMIQEKHNFLVDRYNQKPEYTLDVKNNVYCKTVDGQFFDARFELKVYPYIDKGIGLIGMLTKKHDCELMLFLDAHGNIVDCSSEILNEFRSNFTLNKHINIEEIAPELKKTNDAFNVINIPKSMVLGPGSPGLIRPKTGIESASASKSKFSSKIVREDTQAPKEQRSSVRQSQIFTFEPNLESAARLISTRQTEVQKTDGFIQQTTERDQIMSPLETNPEPFKFKEEPEVVTLPKSKNIAALFLTHITTKHSHPVSREQVRKEFININEAEKICEEVSNEKEKKISFFKQDPLSNTFIKLSYFVKIDLLWFENQFYKVVKVRKPTAKDMTLDDERTPRWQVGSKRESQLGFKSYGHSLFDNKLNKNDRSLKLASGSYSGSIQGRKGEEEARNTLLSIEAIIDREEENPKLLEGKNNKEIKREENTKVEKVLNDLLRKGEESMLTKAYFVIFYFSMFLMLVLATVDFVITRNSFQQIELGARLVDADGERFISLTKLWAMSNSVYTFMLQNKTMPADLESTPFMNQQADIIRTNTRELGLLLLDINSEEIITAFYQKSIHFWEVDSDPEMSIIAYNVFDGINIMLDKLLQFTASKRGVLLDNPDVAVFALNNSANDLGSASLNEMTVAMQVSSDIYNSNAKTLMVLLGIEITAMGLIFLSLVGLAFKIKNTQGRLFIVLSTISARNFEIRSKELIKFRNNLEESLESRKFIRQLNVFLEEDLETRNQTQAKEFKLRDKTKFSFFSIKVRNILMLTVALFLFLFILALQSYASRYATQTIDKLKKIDAAAYLAKTMGYEVNVLHGNFIYMLNFLFRADVKTYNDSPEIELYYNLGALTQANRMLIQVFTSEDNFYNPVLDQLLHSNACPFLDPAILNHCKTATKGEILGLLGVNLQFLDIATTYAELFLSNPSPQNADDTVYAYITASTPYIATADRAYGFMRANLMQTLLDTITEENETNQPLYIATCLVCLIVALLVRLIVLENFKRLEISKYKILMIIPQTIVLNNKAIVMYLKNEFKKELKTLL